VVSCPASCAAGRYLDGSWAACRPRRRIGSHPVHERLPPRSTPRGKWPNGSPATRLETPGGLPPVPSGSV